LLCLRLACCTFLTDECLRTVVHAAPLLQDLDLQCCGSLSPAGIDCVAELNGCGARFPTGIYTRGCHWIPRMFASSEHACDQWHSSRKFTFLTSSHCKLRANTEQASTAKPVQHPSHHVRRGADCRGMQRVDTLGPGAVRRHS
jgi:hypothetical protein